MEKETLLSTKPNQNKHHFFPDAYLDQLSHTECHCSAPSKGSKVLHVLLEENIDKRLHGGEPWLVMLALVLNVVEGLKEISPAATEPKRLKKGNKQQQQQQQQQQIVFFWGGGKGMVASLKKKKDQN